MRRCHVVVLFLTIFAGCSASPPGEGAGAPDAALATGGRGPGAAGSGGSGGTAPVATGGSPGAGGSGGSSAGTGGAPGAGGGTGGAGTPDLATETGDGSNPGNVIWYADPAQGNAAFKNVETEGGCTVTIVEDPEHGKVRKFNRPPGTNRCEAKGAAGYNTKEGEVVYVGMRYKIEAPMNLTVTGIFQWKTYDTPGHPNTLNFPILFRPSGGRLNVEVQKPASAAGGGGLSGGTVIWSIPTPIGQWFTLVLGIKQSYDPKVGWVEVYYNGQPQKLSDGSMRLACQTLDGGFIDPKWGIYGTTSSPKPQSATFVGDIRIARDYASAAPESY